jgi:DNA-directed RNA polymerase specialized sigma24 family protein
MPGTPLEQLFAQYYEPLVRMLDRRTGDQDRAEDLAQEVFARALAAPPDTPRPWLFAGALNLVRDEGRRAVRQGAAGAAAGRDAADGRTDR